MSYCRWSSDNYTCDLYVYPTEGNTYLIHVASTQLETPVPPLPSIHEVGADAYVEAYKKQSEFLKHAKHIPITLPYAGESFAVSGLSELKSKLIELRSLGYRFPNHVFERIEEEIDHE